jgi:WD40 repeat protein
VVLVTPTAISPEKTPSITPPLTLTPKPESQPTAALTAVPTEDAIDSLNESLVTGSFVWELKKDNYQDVSLTLGGQPWSPDGNSLVGWSRKQKNLAILEVNKGLLSLIEGTSAYYSTPYWSPDGRYLLYSIPNDAFSLYSIAIYDLVTNQEMMLETDVRLLSIAGWSYDSSEIAFVRWAGEGENLHTVLEIIDLVSGSIQELTDPLSLAFAQASWSPIAKQLAVYVTPGLPPDNPALPVYSFAAVYLVDIKTGEFEPLIISSENDKRYYIHSFPWSRKGDKIIYSDTGTICYTQLAIREETCLMSLAEKIDATGSNGARYPSWSNDGEWVSFILQFESQQCNPIAIARIDGDAFRFTDAESGKCDVFGPIWAPTE